MPRTTRTQEPGDPRMPRRPGQDASSSSATADGQAAGRRARARSTERESPAADAVSRSSEQPAAPAYDDIARRAYELYRERGGNEGQDMDDWLRAEAELRARRGRRDDEL